MKNSPNPLASAYQQLAQKYEDLASRYLVGRRVSPKAHQYMLDSLLEEAELDVDYVVLTLGACLIATLGLLSNSAAVIIGAMLVAPLMSPIRSVAFGILEGDLKIIETGLKALGVGTAIAIILSAIIGWGSGFLTFGSEVTSRSSPTLLDLGIAIAAGGISGYVKVQPKLSSTLAGTAIAVALMPPLCVVGLGLSQLDWALSWGAMLLYCTNLLGITLSCMVAFLLAGYSPFVRARRPLGVVVLLTSVLVIPLGLSLFQLVRQNQLEANVQLALIEDTETFRTLELISSETDWQVSPPVVTMEVNASEEITPYQVELLEQYISRRMNQPFRFVFEVREVQNVTRDSPSSNRGLDSLSNQRP